MQGEMGAGLLGLTPSRSCEDYLLEVTAPGGRMKPGWGIDTYQNCSVHATHTAHCGASLRVSHREGLCAAVHAEAVQRRTQFRSGGADKYLLIPQPGKHPHQHYAAPFTKNCICHPACREPNWCTHYR